MSSRTIDTPFPRAEYETRVERVKERMEEHGIDVLVSSDPANMNYLTGYDGDSYYLPQAVVISPSLEGPLWIGRGMDRSCALATTYLAEENLIGYGDEFVIDTAKKHPMTVVAEVLVERGLDAVRVGTENDTICFTPRGLDALRATLPKATFIDADLLVNWIRTVKSDAEIDVMREAGRLSVDAMETAASVIRPGVRGCDAAGEVYRRLVGGNAEFGGSFPLGPSMPSGTKTDSAHLNWTDAPYENGAAVNIELAGSRHRYHCALSRPVHLGTPPRALERLAEATIGGFEAMLERIAPGVTCHEVATVFHEHIERYGYHKDSRCGYAIGIGYPPAIWIERTMSLAPGDRTPLKRNMTLHIVPGIWLEGSGVIFSETIVVTDSGYESLSPYARKLLIV